MRRWPNVRFLLAQRLRRFPNSKPTFGQRLMFAGNNHDNLQDYRDYTSGIKAVTDMF